MQINNNKSKIVIGIDPGYDRLGVAVVGGIAARPEYIYSTCIETDKKLDFSERLFELYKKLSDVIEKYKPTEASIEDIFIITNQKTAVKVAQARGVCMLTCQMMGVKVNEYTPLQVKSSMTGYGRADKSQVEFIVRKLLKLDNNPDFKVSNKKKDDEIDAIAIAVTHLFLDKKY
jgi:crossover junction endodeoxyribonuclease RuvC